MGDPRALVTAGERCLYYLTLFLSYTKIHLATPIMNHTRLNILYAK